MNKIFRKNYLIYNFLSGENYIDSNINGCVHRIIPIFSNIIFLKSIRWGKHQSRIQDFFMIICFLSSMCHFSFMMLSSMGLLKFLPFATLSKFCLFVNFSLFYSAILLSQARGVFYALFLSVSLVFRNHATVKISQAFFFSSCVRKNSTVFFLMVSMRVLN